MPLEKDQVAFWTLPRVPFDGCRRTGARVGYLSLVRFNRNAYSVSGCHSLEEGELKGDADRVEIRRRGEAIARRTRRGSQGELSREAVAPLLPEQMNVLPGDGVELFFGAILDAGETAPCYTETGLLALRGRRIAVGRCERLR